MRRHHLTDLIAFVAIAQERSFTRAAARMGVSSSSLSHTMRALEEGLGVRLLTRTTRSVTLTDAGERLLDSVAPRLEGIESDLAELSQLRGRPTGTIRITASEHIAQALVWPTLKRLMADYPDINVELAIDQSLTDIVAARYDAGVRMGGQIAKDMIAVPIGPALRMAVVGSPSYLAERGRPQTPQALTDHECINLRLATLGGLYAWEFEKAGRTMNVRVGGRIVLNDVPLILDAASAGLGLACVPDDHVAEHLSAGRLVRLLEDWCPPFPGYHLYYPSRRQASPAFALLVEALRYRA